MHPRNPYAEAPPDFITLANAIPSFRPFVEIKEKGAPTINFKDANALRALTSALLQRDFRLSVVLLENRLCPAVSVPAFVETNLVTEPSKVPGRLDYVLFLQDIVRADRAASLIAGQLPHHHISGLDIGTGASAIYPLLFCRIDGDVRMMGTDVDEASLKAAQANIDTNQLDSKIQLLQSSVEAPFFDTALEQTSYYDFSMCNPPFYSSTEEMELLAEEKEFSPHAVCTGTHSEMITSGGEGCFVSRMARESKLVQERIRWFSSLLGKASSVKKITAELADLGCTNYALVEFSQGYTQRWAVAWSWSNNRLPDSIARQIPPSPLTKLLPLPNTLYYICPATLNLPQARIALLTLLEELDVQLNQSDAAEEIIVKSRSISWSRAARRAKQRGETNEKGQDETLICSAFCTKWHSADPADTTSAAELVCTWLKGQDRHAFESFFSYLVRKIATEALNSRRK